MQRKTEQQSGLSTPKSTLMPHPRFLILLFAIVLLAASASAVDCSSSRMWLALNESTGGSGTVLEDSCSTNNDFNRTTTTERVAGIIDPTATTDAAQQYYNGATGDNIYNYSTDAMGITTGNRTYMAWVKTGSASVGAAQTIARIGRADGSAQYEYLMFYINNINRFHYWCGTGTTYREKYTTWSYAGSTWYHLVVVYNSSHLALWVNGSLDTVLAATDCAGQNGTFYLGNNDGAGSASWRGLIDETAYWNTDLNSTQIYNLYMYGTLGSPSFVSRNATEAFNTSESQNRQLSGARSSSDSTNALEQMFRALYGQRSSNESPLLNETLLRTYTTSRSINEIKTATLDDSEDSFTSGGVVFSPTYCHDGVWNSSRTTLAGNNAYVIMNYTGLPVISYFNYSIFWNPSASGDCYYYVWNQDTDSYDQITSKLDATADQNQTGQVSDSKYFADGSVSVKILTTPSDCYVFEESILWMPAQTEPLSLSETTYNKLSGFRVASSAIVQAELVNRLLSNVRTFSDSASINLLAERTIDVSISLIDTFVSSDSISRFISNFIEAVDSMDMQLFVGVFLYGVRSIVDSLALADSQLRFSQRVTSLSDSFGLSDELTRMLQKVTSISDSFSISDRLDRVLSSVRDATDLFSLSDSIQGYLSWMSTLTDAFSMNDAGTINVFFSRGDSEIFTFGDNAGRLLFGARVAADSLSPSETLSRWFGTTSSVIDSFSLTDSTSRFFVGFRLISDSANLNDIITRMLSAVRNATDSFGLVDSLDIWFGSMRWLSDVFNLNEAGTVNVFYQRGDQDTVTFSDAQERSFYGLRVASESLNIAESLTRWFGVSRTMTDSFSLTDSVSRLFSGFMSASDSINIQESISRMLYSIRSLTDAFNLSDYTARFFGSMRWLSDALSMNEAGYVNVFYQRGDTDTVYFGDSPARLLYGARVASESLNVAESVSRIFGSIKSATDSISINDSLSRLYSSMRDITDAMNLNESVSRLLMATRSIQDVFSLADSVVKEVVFGWQQFTRAATDSLGISDLLSRLFSTSRSSSEGLSLSDFTNWMFAGVRTSTESLNIGEGADRLIKITIKLTDSFNISELANRVRGVMINISDAFSISDFIANVLKVLGIPPAPGGGGGITIVCTAGSIREYTCPTGEKITECSCIQETDGSTSWSCIENVELLCPTAAPLLTIGGVTVPGVSGAGIEPSVIALVAVVMGVVIYTVFFKKIKVRG